MCPEDKHYKGILRVREPGAQDVKISQDSWIFPRFFAISQDSLRFPGNLKIIELSGVRTTSQRDATRVGGAANTANACWSCYQHVDDLDT